jgi:ODP family beta lactamase
MNGPTMLPAREVASDTICLPSYTPVADFGLLAVNAFVIKGTEPVLVDTGLGALGNDFIATLEDAIDPSDLKWIWLSHMDPDHLGSLTAVLGVAPNAKVVTNFLGMAKMMLLGRDVSRVHLLEQGQALDAGDRTLVPFRPPYYDAPETRGFFDTRTRTLFTADAFGALLAAPAEDARAVKPGALKEGMSIWAGIDAPWLGSLDETAFGRTLDRIERLDPATIISGHLPEAAGMTRTLVSYLDGIRSTGPADGPDHALIDQIVAESAPAPLRRSA